MTYAVHSSTAATVKAWMNIDITDPAFGDWDDLGGGTPSAPCPSKYFEERTHYYSNSFGDTPVITGGHAGQDYPFTDPHSGQAGHMTCLAQGQTDMWDANRTVGTHSRTMKFHLNPNATQGTACIRAYISVGTIASLYARSNSVECFTMQQAVITGNVQSEHYLATGKPLGGVRIDYSRTCDYATRSSVYTDGSGQFTFVTGQGQHYCIWAPDPLINTAGGMDVQGTNYYSPQSSDPPDDPSGNPINYMIAHTCDQAACGSADFALGQDFVYNPVPTAPNIVKTSSFDPGGTSNANGVQAAPGQPIYYQMYTNNTLDSNSSSAVIVDQIPLNIDQDSVVIDDVSLSPFGMPPGVRPVSAQGTWSNDTFVRPGSQCILGVSNPFSMGYGGFYDVDGVPFDGSEVNPSGSEFHCLYTRGTPTDPANIKVTFSVMPAYSQVLVRWHGNVKASDDIGVYPGDPGGPRQPNGSGLRPGTIYPSLQGDYRYCGSEQLGNGTGTPDYSSNAVIDDCTDYEHGVQSASNFGYSTVDGSVPTFSNITYSPIPGTISCVSKDVGFANYDVPSPPRMETFPPVGDKTCALKTVNPPTANIIISDKFPYNTPTFKINVGTPPGAAPVYYDVTDQQCTDGGSCTPIDPIFTNIQDGGTFGDSGTVADRIGHQSFSEVLLDTNRGPIWREYKSLQDTQAVYNFGATVQNTRGVTPGATITNTGCAQIIHYESSSWGPIIDGLGYPRTSGGCSMLTMKFVDIISPHITAEKSHVAAGGDAGGPSSASCNKTLDQYGSGPFISTRSGSTGRYLITASGPVSGITSAASATSEMYPGTPLGYCYEDLVKNIERYIKKPSVIAAGHVKTDISPNPSNGDVVVPATPLRGPGPTDCYPLNGPLNITTRWTLYVKGNLCIRGNITYSASVLAASFGVIVDGNIYIDKDVTNLDGYYYSAPGDGVPGIINTCANSGSKTLSETKRDVDSGDTANYSPQQCQAPLQVRGLLMANTLRLNRTGKVSGPNAASEYLESFAQLYLLTPPGFDDLSSIHLTPIGQQQLLPRY